MDHFISEPRRRITNLEAGLTALSDTGSAHEMERAPTSVRRFAKMPNNNSRIKPGAQPHRIFGLRAANAPS